MDLRGKRVTVVGLGKSGIAASNLLIDKGAKVNITDCLDTPKIRENIQKLKNRKSINIEIGKHTEDLVRGQDLVVASPGVCLSSLPILWAKQKGIPVIGEIELAFAFCSAPIIAITGTNGKTTVSTLIGQIFHQAERKYVVCGNIGTPFSAKVSEISPEHIIILEVSSFQLETIHKFKPNVAAVLNLSIDHLDRYASFDEYLHAKCRIFSNQKEEDWAVFNAQDPHRARMQAKAKIKAKVLHFSRDKYLNSNYSAAVTISSLFAIPKELAFNTCCQFKGLKHRLEQLRQIRGVRFINDSKATNVDSTVWALSSINEPVVLVAGGKDKGSNFALAAIRDEIKKKVRAMIVIGEAKEKIKAAFQDLVLVKIAADISDAAWEAFCLARPGDCVLLSPMCASFDMFADYAERGEAFRKAVESLK